MRQWVVFICTFFLCLPGFAQSNDVGLFVRNGFSSITAPVANQTYVFNTANGTLYVWSGSAFLPITTPKQNLAAVVAPTTANDNTQGYAIGSIWFDTVLKNFYIASSVQTSSAIWDLVTGDNSQPASTAIFIKESDVGGNFVATGMVGSPPLVPALNMTSPSGAMYLMGSRVSVNSSIHSYPPSSWTFDFAEPNGAVVHYPQSPFTSPPSDPGLLFQIVVTNGTAITAVNGQNTIGSTLLNVLRPVPGTFGLPLIVDSSKVGGLAYQQMPLQSLSQGSATTGQVATWNGSAWVAAPSASGGIASVSGGGHITASTTSGAVTLGDDGTLATLAGTQTLTNKTINGNQVVTSTLTLDKLAQSSASSGQVPEWNGSAWIATTPAVPSGGGGFGGDGSDGPVNNPTPPGYPTTINATNFTLNTSYAPSSNTIINTTGTFTMNTGATITPLTGAYGAPRDETTVGISDNGSGPQGGRGANTLLGGGGGGGNSGAGGNGGGNNSINNSGGGGTFSSHVMTVMPSGGGAGGSLGSFGSGGHGGDAGGILRVISAGDISLTNSTCAITAIGSAGGSSGGGGGGGSGGDILMYSQSQILMVAGVNLAVGGGDGGAGSVTNASGGGGGGAGTGVFYAPTVPGAIGVSIPGGNGGATGGGTGVAGNGGWSGFSAFITGKPTLPVIAHLEGHLSDLGVIAFKRDGVLRINDRTLISFICALDSITKQQFDNMCYLDSNGVPNSESANLCIGDFDFDSLKAA